MTEKNAARPRKLYDIKDITGLYDLSRATIYRKIKEGTFPRPLKVGKRAVRWHPDMLTDWENNLSETEA